MAEYQNYLLTPGTLLGGGRFRVERHIATGGFGITYLARDIEMDQPVVVKEFFMRDKAHRAADGLTVEATTTGGRGEFERHRAKFRKEAQRIYKLRHPNIVRVFALFDEKGTSYYVMEYFDGGSLVDRMNRMGGHLPEPYVRHVLDVMLDALEYVHAQHLWHLDIKPANIMLTSKDQPILIDFGASKWVTDDDKVLITSATSNAYTNGYAPLEQVAGTYDDFGPWTDFYALGATLYKVLTGITPPQPYALINNPGLLTFDGVSVTPAMQTLVRSLMQSNHLQRPQSAAQVRALLESLTPKRAKQPEPQPQRRQFLEVEPASQPKEPKPRSGMPKWLWGLILVFLAVVIALLAIVLSRQSQRSNDYYQLEPEDRAVVDSVEDVADEENDEEPAKVQEKMQVTDYAYTNSAGSFSYTGTVNANGKPDGEGTATFRNDDTFKGTFSNGNFVKGRYDWADGSYFTGSFKSNNEPDYKQGIYFDKSRKTYNINKDP